MVAWSGTTSARFVVNGTDCSCNWFEDLAEAQRHVERERRLREEAEALARELAEHRRAVAKKAAEIQSRLQPRPLRDRRPVVDEKWRQRKHS
jgi:hypothetical protein